MKEDEMVGWHHSLNGHEFGRAIRVKSACINFIHGNKKGNQEALEGVQLASWGTPKWKEWSLSKLLATSLFLPGVSGPKPMPENL